MTYTNSEKQLIYFALVHEEACRNGEVEEPCEVTRLLARLFLENSYYQEQLAKLREKEDPDELLYREFLELERLHIIKYRYFVRTKDPAGNEPIRQISQLLDRLPIKLQIRHEMTHAKLFDRFFCRTEPTYADIARRMKQSFDQKKEAERAKQKKSEASK